VELADGIHTQTHTNTHTNTLAHTHTHTYTYTYMYIGFYDPGRDELDLPPLASFYRHNNFGREVITVDKADDPDLALAVMEASKEVPAS
jgi:hypothetical protein